MLHYHILRVQLEGARPWMHEKQRVRARQQAIEARCKGFAEETLWQSEWKMIAGLLRQETLLSQTVNITIFP